MTVTMTVGRLSMNVTADPEDILSFLWVNGDVFVPTKVVPSVVKKPVAFASQVGYDDGGGTR